MINPVARYPEAVQVELINSMFRLSSYLFFGLVMVIYVIANYYWDKLDASILYPWLIANIILVLFRVVMVKLFHQLKPTTNIMTWGYVYLATSIVSGMLWAYVSLFMLDMSDTMSVVLVVIMLTGMVSGSMVPLAYFPPTHLLFTALTLVPLSFVIFSSEQNVMLTVGFVLVVFTFVMFAFTFLVSKNMINSVLLRFENVELLDSLREQKALAEQASVEKSRFLAATSHDLRQPLHALDLYLGALKNKISDRENTELLEKSQNSSLALSQLLNALMDISNLDAGNINVEKKAFDLSKMLHRLMDEFYPVAEEKNINLSNYVESVIVYSDELLVGRIVRNLLSNAVKHNQRCSIDIVAQDDNEKLKLCVKDSGKGVASNELDKIFSEFYQLDNPERDRNKGLGLGLAIVSRLAELLQHPLSVQSEPGKGSQFCIELPKSVNDIDADESDRHDINPELIEGSFIVCIDDEKEVRDALRHMLRSWGCEVMAADSADAVLKELKQPGYVEPDLILSDYRLRSNKTGIEAVTLIRESVGRFVPAIIITGDTSPEISQQAEKKDIVTLIKPLDSVVLFKATIEKLKPKN